MIKLIIFSIYLISLLSCYGEDNKVIDLVRSSFKKAEVVYMMKNGIVTIYKESDQNKAMRMTDDKISIIIFENKPKILKIGGRKDSNIELDFRLSMMIKNEKVLVVPLVGTPSLASFNEVNKVLEELCENEGHKPLIIPNQ